MFVLINNLAYWKKQPASRNEWWWLGLTMASSVYKTLYNYKMFHKLQYTDGKWSEWRNSRWRSKLVVYYWPIIVWPRLSCYLWFIKYRSREPNWPADDLKFTIQIMPELILNCFIVRPKISAIMVEVPRKCKWHDRRRRAAPHGLETSR